MPKTKLAKKSKARNPHHKPAVGFTAEDYPTLSAINRALPEAPKSKKGAGKKGALDINAILLLVQQVPALLAVFQSLIGMFPKKPKPVVEPIPTPSPGPSPQPGPAPTPAPVASERRIVSGKSTILGVEGWKGKPNSHYSLGGGTVANIRNGTEFCGAGYRIHVDTTPRDQFGVAFQNIDLHRQPEIFAQDPTQVVQTQWGGWTCQEGNNRVHHYITVDGREYGPMGDLVAGAAWQEQEVIDLTSEYDDAGLTPVLLVPYDIPLSEEHKVSYRAEHVAADGTVTRFDPTPTFKVKAWGV